MQPALFSTTQWTVSALTRHVRDALESDTRLQDLWVEGEISNSSRPSSGHLYFTLKDAGAALRCVMWRSNAARLDLALQDGMAVAAHGRIGVYEVGGQYQLYVDRLIPSGEGALYQEFLRLRAELTVEGLFEAERKRSIPERPLRIGVVTSQTGAAFRDVLNTLKRRMPLVEVILASASVQGEESPAQLVQAMRKLNWLTPRPEVILLVRGGGSIEDLWAFNHPEVVRAVAASEAPVICGVGHETDFTLADLAADLRAPTPTAAAELATPITGAELREKIAAGGVRLADAFRAMLEANRDRIAGAAKELRYYSPERRILSDRQRLDEFGRRLHAAQVHRLALHRSQTDGWRRRLLALSPVEVLKRGYAVVTRQENGEVIRRVRQAQNGIRIRVADGSFDAEVRPRPR